MAKLEFFAYRRESPFFVGENGTCSKTDLTSAYDSKEDFHNNIEKQKIPKKDTSTICSSGKTFKGLIYTVLCSVFITLSSVIVKKMTYIDSGELSLVRNVGVLVGCIPIVAYVWENPLGPKHRRILLCLRGFIGATALYLNLLAFRLLPISQAAIIISSLPALVMITARIFLKESCGIIQSISVVITLAGVLLSIVPELSENSMGFSLTTSFITGFSSAVGCIILLSATFVSLRMMKDVHFSVVLVNLGIFGVIENATLTALFGQYNCPQCGGGQYAMMLVGVFGFLGHCFLTLAIQAEAAGVVSVVKSSSDILVALFFQTIFFDQVPNMYSFAAAALVIFSVSLIGVRKWLQQLPPESQMRERLHFLLM